MNFVKDTEVAKLIKTHNMQYFMLLGMRSNGKSCAVRSYCLKQAIESGKMFFYLRRYANDLQIWRIESYFTNVKGFDVKKITDGEYDFIKCKQGKLYLAKREIVNNKEKIFYGQQIGYVGALSDSEHLKSLNFPNCSFLIFEEFITDKIYLNDETNKLFNVVSTIFRNENGTVFLIGNTITEINPYFREWELSNIATQKVGSVDIYFNDTTKIAVWLTATIDTTNLGSNKMSFGEQSRMIKNGLWERKQKRKLEKNYKDYNVLYTMVLEFSSKMFLMELLEYNDSHVWYVSKKTSNIQKDTRIISDGKIENDFTTIGFVPLNTNENRAFSLLKQGKIAYCDNLTGTQFIQCFQQMEKGII